MATASNRPPKIPTAEDLALVPTCGEIYFPITNVTWPDGSPFEITLRALDAAKAADIDRKAVQAGVKHGTQYDDYTALVWTVFHGIVRPTLTEEQIGVLWKMNRWVLEQIADYLETLQGLPARELQAHMERMAGSAIPEKKKRAPAASRKRRTVGSPVAAGDTAGAASQNS